MNLAYISICILTKGISQSVVYKSAFEFRYLGNKKQGIAKKWIDNYRKHMKLIDEMTLINMELIRRTKVDPDKNKKIS